MKIITPEFEASFKDYPIGSQTDKKDPLVIERIYNSCTSTEWFLLEYDQTKKFGYGIAKNKIEEKAGFFNLAEMELETLRNPNQNKIYRDIKFKPNRLSVLLKEINEERTLDQDYIQFLKSRHFEVQEIMASGEIKTPKELQSILIQLCKKTLANKSYSFLSDYLSFSWFGNKSFFQLKNLDGDLAEFLLSILSESLALDVFNHLVKSSDGFRFLTKGGETISTSISLIPRIGLIDFHEHWKNRAHRYKEKNPVKSVKMDH